MGARDSWALSVPISQEGERSVFRMGMAGVQLHASLTEDTEHLIAIQHHH